MILVLRGSLVLDCLCLMLALAWVTVYSSPEVRRKVSVAPWLKDKVEQDVIELVACCRVPLTNPSSCQLPVVTTDLTVYSPASLSFGFCPCLPTLMGIAFPRERAETTKVLLVIINQSESVRKRVSCDIYLLSYCFTFHPFGSAAGLPLWALILIGVLTGHQ